MCEYEEMDSATRAWHEDGMNQLTPAKAAELIKGATPVNDTITDSPKGLRRQFTLANKRQKGITVFLPVDEAGDVDMARLCKSAESGDAA